MLPFTEDSVVFGMHLKDNQCDSVMNNLILLAEFFIHICICRIMKPLSTVFQRSRMDNYHFLVIYIITSGLSLFNFLNSTPEFTLFNNYCCI